MLVIEQDQALQANQNPGTAQPIPIVHTIDLRDESISAGLTSDFSSTEDLARTISAELAKALARDSVRDVISRIASGAESIVESLKNLAPADIADAPAFEKGVLVQQLLAADTAPEIKETTIKIIESINFGAGLSMGEVKAFFTGLKSYCQNNLEELFRVVASRQQALDVADALVESLLHDIASNLQDPLLRARFLDPTLSDRDMLEVLRYAGSEERLNFVETVYEVGPTSPAVQAFLQGKLDNVLHHTSTEERIALTRYVIDGANSSLAPQFAANILMASRNLGELKQIVDAVGQDLLLQTGNPELREYVAHTVLGSQLRNLELPPYLEEDAAGKQIDEALEKSVAALEDALRIIDQSPFADSALAQDFRAASTYNIEQLKAARENVNSCAQLREIANVIRLKSELDFKYCVKLTDQEAGLRPYIMEGVLVLIAGEPQNWTSKELLDVKAALERLPEGLLLLTPRLTEIQRVDFIGPGIMAARYPEGIIRVGSLAVDSEYVTSMFPGVSSLQVVLTHEIGHGIQLGAAICTCEIQANGLDPFTRADPRYEFRDFLDLSKWQIVDKSHYQMMDGNRSVVVDGEPFCLYTPYRHNGKEIVFVYDHGNEILYCVDAFAPFSVDRYGRSNPWEDWAVSFAEYHYTPERLITFAPEKFQYFEQEFRVYGARTDLQEKLASSLAKRGKSYSPAQKMDGGELVLAEDREQARGKP